MSFSQEDLLKVFGDSAEVCAGSILLVVDGVKQEVATANLHTGAYTLSADGERLVKDSVKPRAPTGVQAAKKTSAKGSVKKDTPIESQPLPGIEPVTEVAAETVTATDVDASIEDALAGLDIEDGK